MEYFLEGIVSFKDIGTFTQMRRVTNTYKFSFLYYREYITSFKEMLHFKAPAKMFGQRSVFNKKENITTYYLKPNLLVTVQHLYCLHLHRCFCWNFPTLLITKSKWVTKIELPSIMLVLLPEARLLPFVMLGLINSHLLPIVPRRKKNRRERK